MGCVAMSADSLITVLLLKWKLASDNFAECELKTILALNLALKNTDQLSEGSTNQYYTTARANSAIDTKFTQKYIYDSIR